MAMDVNSREQRLRKQAELQYLSGNLANLRERESSYTQASAAVPELLLNQINEVRREIRRVEEELLDLQDDSIDAEARRLYWEAFEAELAADLNEALRLYKGAARKDYPDADAAVKSVRYKMKSSRLNSALGKVWMSAPARQSRNRLLVGLSLLLILALMIIFIVSRFLAPSEEAVAVEPADTTTPTPTPPAVILIVPDTATPLSLPTGTPTASPTATPTPTRPAAATPSVETPTPTVTPTLRPALRIIEPKNGLTWGDGAIVFEFQEVDLAFDELYCVNTLRGFDRTNTENWSFPPVGNKEPHIPIEANVFRIAKTQGMRCIVWSAGIGKGSCDNIISHVTEERMIGLPQPCRFN